MQYFRQFFYGKDLPEAGQRCGKISGELLRWSEENQGYFEKK